MHTLEVPVGRLEATITVFGPEDAKQHGLVSWSLKGLQFRGDVARTGALASTLSQKLRDLDIAEVFAPNPTTANAVVVNPHELRDEILLGQSLLHRDQFMPADGVLLYPRKAFMMSGAGCPLIVASAGDLMIVSHAARDSLIDRRTIEGKPARKHFSIVNAIIDKFVHRRARITDIEMVMLFAIPTNEFEHNLKNPEWGIYNRKLVTHVKSRWPDGIFRPENNMNAAYLNLEQVFMGQATQAGVRKARVEHSLAKYPDLVHTCVGANAHQRNLFIVRRNA